MSIEHNIEAQERITSQLKKLKPLTKEIEDYLFFRHNRCYFKGEFIPEAYEHYESAVKQLKKKGYDTAQHERYLGHLFNAVKIKNPIKEFDVLL